MSVDEIFSLLKVISENDVVIRVKADESGYILMEIRTPKDRSQLVKIQPKVTNNGVYIIASSVIGTPPRDVDTLIKLLHENMDGSYTRTAINDDGELIQFYRYPIEELEPKEFSKAILEIAQFADAIEHNYFDEKDDR
jgi:hypothetical protein